MWIPLALLCTAPAAAPAGAQGLSHWMHRSWTVDDGAPSQIKHIAQDRDGWLWIAASGGVYRFDGVTFDRIDPTRGPVDDQARRVLPTSDGSVWVWYDRAQQFGVYKDGTLQLLEPPKFLRGRLLTVIDMQQTPDGAIWVGLGERGTPLLVYRAGKWRQVGPSAGLPNSDFTDILGGADGTLWVSFVGSVLRKSPAATRFTPIITKASLWPTLSEDGSGRVWVSEADGSYPITAPGGRSLTVKSEARRPADPSRRRGATIFDRWNNLWSSTRTLGVALAPATDANSSGPSQWFRSADGLSSDVTSALLNDREGNVWVATSRGLDRFRLVDIVAEKELEKPARYGDILYAAGDGSVYIGQANAVYRVRPGGEPEIFLQNVDEPEAICDDNAGAIWIAGSRNISVVSTAGVRRLTRPPKAETGLYDCAADREGTVWFTAAGSGMYRWTGSAWQSVFGETTRTTFHPTTMAKDQDGTLVLSWADGTLARLDPPAAAQILRRRAHDFLNIVAVTPATDGLMLGGRDGLTWDSPMGWRFLPSSRVSVLRDVNGMAHTAAGYTWLQGSAGIIRIATRALQRAFLQSKYIPPYTLFGYEAGLRDPFPSQSWRSVVKGGDGRLWFATAGGTVWIDPDKVGHNSRPPGVAIAALRAGGRLWRDPRSLALPKGLGDVQIDYTALSFRMIRNVIFRYRLEGHDKNWIDPGQRRSATYTNLAPGNYRFQVIAADEDGVWNRSGATVLFTVQPTFFQSWWWVAICTLFGVAVLALAYRLRLTQATATVRRRLEERLAERERIAGELHDTLLQGVQGLVLRFQAIAERLPSSDVERQRIEGALARADEVILEGRERVRDLRPRSIAPSIADALREQVEGIDFDDSVCVYYEERGSMRPLRPMIIGELGAIAREALFNIKLHAHAATITLLSDYRSDGFRLVITDDGVGIDPDILDHGARDGHFGLPGMRERMVRLGGTLAIEHANPGTRLCARLPRRLAYPDHRPLWHTFLDALRGGHGA